MFRWPFVTRSRFEAERERRQKAEKRAAELTNTVIELKEKAGLIPTVRWQFGGWHSE